jgi:hypothetical protein
MHRNSRLSIYLKGFVDYKAFFLMKRLILLVSLCATIFAKADINNIPQRDLKNVKQLFEDLIKDHDYSYTIFGSKPMSLADFVLEVTKDQPIYKWIKSQIFVFNRKVILKSWDTYKQEFDFKDFIFLDDEKDLFDCLVLVLINKKNMLRVLREHEAIFKEELGDDFTPELFLENLERRKISLAKAIHDSDKLLGIMLGYGVRNATVFQERYDLMKEIAKAKKENFFAENELIAKLNTLEAQVGDFSSLEEDALIPPLYFLADVFHPETIELKRQYEQDRQNIEKMMKKPNFMDIVLQRLIE